MRIAINLDSTHMISWRNDIKRPIHQHTRTKVSHSTTWEIRPKVFLVVTNVLIPLIEDTLNPRRFDF